MNKKILYTIGYAGFGARDFIKELKKRQVTAVVDVRSKPYSKFHSDYNKEAISEILSQQNIHYLNFDKSFGARQTNPKYCTEGCVDFEKFARSEIFLDGINRIGNGYNDGMVIALMCAEKEPTSCHRAILVSRNLTQYDIRHIVSGREDITQSELENRLLAEYFSNRNQLTLLDEQKTDEELIAEAYRLKNQKIGYRQNRGDDG
ncbi:MAG: DUF488 domain-containing protein [Ruminococcus sp.]|jgi:uncharacterized protein (DUF488 family)|nr:DUF488 domain-containing protein [Ruminococcus sp.]